MRYDVYATLRDWQQQRDDLLLVEAGTHVVNGAWSLKRSGRHNILLAPNGCEVILGGRIFYKFDPHFSCNYNGILGQFRDAFIRWRMGRELPSNVDVYELPTPVHEHRFQTYGTCAVCGVEAGDIAQDLATEVVGLRAKLDAAEDDNRRLRSKVMALQPEIDP